MSYLQVNIGRNIDNTPMDDQDWDEFKENIALKLTTTAIGSVQITRDHYDEILAQVEFHTGTGTWDGVEEESCHISLFVPNEIDPGYLRELRIYLANTKRYYSQDAIALITVSELV